MRLTVTRDVEAYWIYNRARQRHELSIDRYEAFIQEEVDARQDTFFKIYVCWSGAYLHDVGTVHLYKMTMEHAKAIAELLIENHNGETVTVDA